jgi:hypothetical protein
MNYARTRDRRRVAKIASAPVPSTIAPIQSNICASVPVCGRFELDEDDDVAAALVACGAVVAGAPPAAAFGGVVAGAAVVAVVAATTVTVPCITPNPWIVQ